MRHWKVYFFKIHVTKVTRTKTFQVPNDQIRLLKRFKDKYLIKKYFLTLYHKKGVKSMENKELYINTLCFAAIFIPLITALVYITALFMDSIY